MNGLAHTPLNILMNEFLPPAGALAAQAEASCITPKLRRPSRPLVALGQFPDPLPEEENPAALFRRGWLRKGGGAFVLAPAGVGKSVWTLQASICWALGRPAFGVEPVRPLTVVVIQAEDDRDEVAEFRNAVRHGLVTEYGFDAGEIGRVLGTDDPSGARVFFHKAVGLWGEAFVEEIGAVLDERPDVDLVIVNPFQSYFGGDCSKNAELSQFLRTWLDREIKDPEDKGRDRAAVMFIHHTNKPPNDKDLRDNWGNDMFAAYIGAGGAEIVNWARAILSLMPTGVPGMFRLIAGKRGQRLGWRDASGTTVYCRVLKHAGNGCIYWREGNAEDEAALEEKRRGNRGAVGGDGGGGRPPDRTVYSPVTVLSYVDCHPGWSEKGYCDGLAEGPSKMARATVQRLLGKAVDEGWLSKNKTPGGTRYDVTEHGRRKLVSCPL